MGKIIQFIGYKYTCYKHICMHQVYMHVLNFDIRIKIANIQHQFFCRGGELSVIEHTSMHIQRRILDLEVAKGLCCAVHLLAIILEWAQFTGCDHYKGKASNLANCWLVRTVVLPTMLARGNMFNCPTSRNTFNGCQITFIVYIHRIRLHSSNVVCQLFLLFLQSCFFNVRR